MSDESSTPNRVRVIREGVASYLPDIDPDETSEWIGSLDGLIDAAGPARARYLMLRLLERAGERHVSIPSLTSTDYVNTIPTENEPWFPGDEELERNFRRLIRWNAAIMVHRAQRPGIGVGGHISTYASSASLYEVGFNHFFRGQEHPGGGDQIYIQGHASPGIYARAFLEGRLTESQLDGFRQEHSHAGLGGGLPSYPHPRLMPDFWQFPTVSMGLGPMNAIAQARVNHYLHDRGIKDTSDQHVWAFLGDGEMDEPESRGLLQIAATEGLDNLTFVVNCNLQRLDGPVRGNGKIIQELESFFRGAGWNVVKVVWGREWDALLHADRDGALVNLMNSTPDGDYQTYRANDGAFVREHFFNRDPRTKELVKDLSDSEIWNLKRGGHDYRKLFAAYTAAMAHKGQPTVILAKTIKGYTLGKHFEGRNATHQMKKLAIDDLIALRDTLRVPFTDAQLEADPYLPPYYNPGPDSPEVQYMLDRRRTLGGFVPSRRRGSRPLHPDTAPAIKAVDKGSGRQQVATTMALVRIFKELLRDPEIGSRIVPIIPDEARTFGMDSWFPSLKIYNRHGQLYTAVDAELMLAYKESQAGQILHEGINEAGSTATFTAVGTAYSTHDEPMIPLYIFYSMFGFQRTGDSFWAAADQMTRGFVIGATAGRTTLTGEGLQHADGHSPLLASSNPAAVIYDPAFAYELAHIVDSGLARMYGEGSENVFFYITVYNEPFHQPAAPDDLDVDALLRGIYRYSPAPELAGAPTANILVSGVMMPDALRAQEMLAADWGVAATVYSVTSWSELARDGIRADRAALLSPGSPEEVPFVASVLNSDATVAVSDFQRGVQEQIRAYVPGTYLTLGTDGFGFSDTRPAARRVFNIDAESIVVGALLALSRDGKVDRSVAAQAAQQYRIDDVNAAPEQTSDPGVA
ncbi:MAG TPA: pyruvate dehydrogenase (acetyl-transferring), homodimeric type [Gordonia sp. (in: high G+C Gram-positive bacteria)]|uniref:pyruvate dehydrogenase (acetyl-transferring), homodimeric type n=2 Tax=unclassified Gordonia (in: high G+C Gram-positive bacteria) TaxID=2657482 RepID=UPI000F951AF3|nr:pyruvate dehydrogenase (acetyl-transferring), homodimeric type [Gordonia sp. (in: high G+C Gram-positive bacteria)]RUP41539.1 MAG: pyruvate dehydrogenase (acetyl-transferring), homodimeric type [Gordonia sp. (in: high G+C Gram-positive bacteria)]HNP56625.1 pyruvate dehydrogenase (acetyl-transferring), homodimeric type [Gordonia sp. (in: high G+C Gram-positive bacteria)]HRC50295.1 pyruvate dehydrogenase (acetyl-transferring), homodimeric type [Gordonia sp. (in: high G+C Gram-positive bacteria)